ncbi:YuiB family protein [Brevibacillus laterosporus]|uniref:YuiB family protein n=1 Tax=Brevibacillus laterosporus TaxID=1465 RepID=UPI000376824D|nr:YuiB family protein [Brevibacillus laterosporus]ATO48836.1 hypothetical protein BrL25_06790 [Brevibacillus laterosporus DSM 25]WNX30694.1 YuiB family protein [Brevibacillus laterosporus]
MTVKALLDTLKSEYKPNSEVSPVMFMALNPITLIISVVLFSILGFGIGFILNMLLKTTWLPFALTIGLIGYVVISLIVKDTPPSIWDYLVLYAGIVGTFASGWTIQILRKKGYRMF